MTVLVVPGTSYLSSGQALQLLVVVGRVILQAFSFSREEFYLDNKVFQLFAENKSNKSLKGGSAMSFSNMRVGGLATGMDIYSIVNDLMRVRRMPVDKLSQQRQILQWQQEDLRSINNSLRTFRDKSFDMRLQKTFMAREAISSNASAVRVSASSEAVAGTYALSVTSLAKGGYLNSSENIEAYIHGQTLQEQFDLADGETINFRIVNGIGENRITVDFEINPAQKSIYDVVKEINGAQDDQGRSLGIKASYDKDLNRFFLMTNKTGANQAIRVEDMADGNFLNNCLKLETGLLPEHSMAWGKDALVNLNGTDFSFSNNSFTVNGVNYHLQSVGATTITIKNDNDTVFNNIKNFITAYNETMAVVRSKLAETRYRDFPPLMDLQREQLTEKQIDQWEEKSRSGLLRSDPTLSSVQSSLRTLLSSGVEGSTLKSLSAIGITTTSNYRSSDLVINEGRLRQAIQDHPEAVMELFRRQAGEGEVKNHNGIARRLYDEVNSAVRLISDRAGSGDSLSRVDHSIMGKQVNRINKEIYNWEDRLKQVEERYWRQFAAMEKAINQLNNQSSWLAQQLGMGGTR